MIFNDVNGVSRNVFSKKQFISDIINGKLKKPMPILSYPGLALTGDTVLSAVTSAECQSRAVAAVAGKCDSLAAVMMMDLSVEAESFGAQIILKENIVPDIKSPIVTCFDDAKKLVVPSLDKGRISVFTESVKLAKSAVTDRPVIAGAAAPFSLAARLTGVTDIMLMCYDEPETVTCLLEKCTEFLVNYINSLKSAGADGVILAEPVSGLLSPDLEAEFSAPYIRNLNKKLNDDGFLVIYHNCGAAVNRMTESIFSNGCDAYHFGNVCDIVKLSESAPNDKLVMGNIDPVSCFRDGTPVEMAAEVTALLEKCSKYPNFVLSSGCDVPVEANWENIDAFYCAYKAYFEV